MSRYINLDEATDLLRGIDATMAGEFVADLLESLPTIEVSEDCISRATALEIYSDLYWIDERLLNFKSELDKVYDELRNAPSVVPQQKEGEWIPCTKEGYPLTELGRREGQKWYGYKCPKCNFIYKGNALTESPFCQNCGAKMRLE